MIAMFQKEEQSPQQVPIYSIGMQAIQISLTMKNANSFGAEPWVRAKTAGLGPRTFGVFFQHTPEALYVTVLTKNVIGVIRVIVISFQFWALIFLRDHM